MRFFGRNQEAGARAQEPRGNSPGGKHTLTLKCRRPSTGRQSMVRPVRLMYCTGMFLSRPFEYILSTRPSAGPARFMPPGRKMAMRTMSFVPGLVLHHRDE